MSREQVEPVPGWLSLAQWFDLSPVRPWEWPDVDASAWTETVQLRNAWDAGIADARDEADMNRRMTAMFNEGPAA